MSYTSLKEFYLLSAECYNYYKSSIRCKETKLLLVECCNYKSLIRLKDAEHGKGVGSVLFSFVSLIMLDILNTGA